MPYVGMSPRERQNSAVELSTMLWAADASAASRSRSLAASSASRRSVDRAGPDDSDSCGDGGPMWLADSQPSQGVREGSGRNQDGDSRVGEDRSVVRPQGVVAASRVGGEKSEVNICEKKSAS